MESDSDRRRQVEQLISSLSEHMKVTQNARLDLVTQLLAMARLELQLSLHDIQQSELDIFCAALEHRKSKEPTPSEPQAPEAEAKAEADNIPSLPEPLVLDASRVTRRRRG